MSVLYTLTRSEDYEGATILFDGVPVNVSNDHPNYLAIKAILAQVDISDEDEAALKYLTEPIKEVEDKLVRLSDRISIKGTSLFMDGDPIENELTDHITRLFAESNGDRDNGYLAYVRFLENLATNPSKKSRKHLIHFVESNKITLNQDGMMVLYKGVRYDNTSATAGYGIVDGVEYDHAHLPNNPGSVVEIPRSKVDPDRDAACSVGLHVGDYTYASGFSQKLLTVLVNPRDIVAVPSDHSNRKMRTTRYTVVGDNEAEFRQPTAFVEAPKPYIEPTNVEAEEVIERAESVLDETESSHVENVDITGTVTLKGENPVVKNTVIEVETDFGTEEFTPEAVAGRVKQGVFTSKVDEFKELIPSIIAGGWNKSLSVYASKRITAARREEFKQAARELGLL